MTCPIRSFFFFLFLPCVLRAADLKPVPKPDPLPEVVVTAPAPGYFAPVATTATKIDADLQDLPVSLQVVPKQLLEDRGVTRLEQALENVSGVQAESSYGGNGATFFNIRGFTSSNSLRDGFRNYGYEAFRDMQAMERIEVLKGPTGALYGGIGSLGGYINTISKTPQPVRFGQLGLTVGSFGLVRPTLDFNSPLFHGASARLNVAYEHNDGFRDDAGYDSFSVAPTFRWNIDEKTTVTWQGEYGRLERDGFDFGVPNLPGYGSLPRTGYYGLPGDYGVNDTYSTTLIVEHRFNDDWKLRLAAHYTYASQLSNQTFPDNYLYAGGDRLPFTTYLGADEDSDDVAVQIELAGKFSTGPVKHQALLGAEYGYLNLGSGPTRRYSFIMSLRHPGQVDDYAFSGQSTGSRAEANTFGIYFSDLVELTPQWKVLLGARGDWFFNETQTVGGDTLTEAEEGHLSTRAGLVWQPIPITSLYASYGRSYLPNIGHSASSAAFSAERGEQFEFGLKQDLVRDRLSATLCAYQLSRDGILTTDPKDVNRLIQAGEQRSRGVEFDLAGEPLPGWKIVASYAYTDAKVRNDTSFPVGNRLSNVPEHSGSIWSTYTVQDGALRGLGAGVGIYYVGQREANLPNTYDLAAYWRTDVTIFYERERWKAQLNVINLFDRHYYTGGETGVFNYTLNPSQPLTWQGSVTYRF